MRGECAEEQLCFKMCIVSNIQAIPLKERRLSTQTPKSRRNFFWCVTWLFTVYWNSRLFLPRCKLSHFSNFVFSLPWRESMVKPEYITFKKDGIYEWCQHACIVWSHPCTFEFVLSNLRKKKREKAKLEIGLILENK